MSLPRLPLQVYDYFIKPKEDEYIFKGDGGEGDCHIWLGAVHEDPQGNERPVLLPCNTLRQARELDVSRTLLFKTGRYDVSFRSMEPDFIHRSCGNALCVNPEHLQYAPPDEPTLAKRVPGEGRKRRELSKDTLNAAYTL